MRPSWIEIDLGAIKDNVRAIRDAVAPAELCAVVKADAYGHGDVPVAEAAIEAGAGRLAVALVEEGARLREAGVDVPILVLSEPLPSDVPEMIRWRLTATAYTTTFVDALGEAVAAAGAGPYPVHLEVDTGMHRVGCDPVEAVSLARRIDADQVLELEGLWTHFPVAEEDAEFTKRQVDALVRVRDRLDEHGIRPAVVHAANTAGALAHPEARLDMVRVGLGVYGLRPGPAIGPDVALRPAMRVVSRVTLVRRLPAGSRPSYGRRRGLARASTVATIPIGYADGLVRSLTDDGGVLIRGVRRPFAGTITMDQVVVDVGDERVEVGDEAVVLGRQGSAEISADEWADRLGTINYEVVCQFGPRLPRRYVS